LNLASTEGGSDLAAHHGFSSRPLVSVIIPAHDGAETIEALLDALGAQTLSPDRFEVLVVDDGSSDPTAPIARAHGFRR